MAAVTGPIIILILGVFSPGEEQDIYWKVADLVIGLLVDCAVLGFSMGLASVLSRYRYTIVSILGMLASILALTSWVWVVMQP